MYHHPLVIASAWVRADYLALAGLVVTTVGFTVAIWQLIRSANAAEATKAAVLALSRAQLLFLLPQFRVLETELDWAISLKTEGRDLAVRILTSYVHLAHEVAGLITVHSLGEDEIGVKLRQSAKLAADAKNKIYATTIGVASLTKELRLSMTNIGEVLSTIGAVQQSNAAAK